MSLVGRMRQLVWRNLAAGGGYALLALLSLQLQPLFGSVAVPFWPPAGLALAFVLFWGLRCTPGLWLGVLLVVLVNQRDWQPDSFALLIATGAVLQALAGGWLIRRVLGGFRPVLSDPQLALSLFLVGPVACVISASVATASLAALAGLPAERLAGTWLAWWAGDSIAVLLFTPLLIYLWPGQPRDYHRIGAQLVMPVLLTMGLLLAGHIGLQKLQAVSEFGTLHKQIDQAVQRESEFVSQWLLAPEFIRGLYAASEDVTREEFEAFLPPLMKYSPLAYADFAARVPAAELAAFEAGKRDAGYGQYTVYELDGEARPRPRGERAEYFPVSQSFPVSAGGSDAAAAATTIAALGLDHGHSPARRAAMEQALVSDRIALARDQLLRFRGERGYLGYVAVYPGLVDSAGLSLEERRAQLQGYVVGIYRSRDLLEPLHQAAQRQGLQVRVWDVTVPDNAETLFATGTGELRRRQSVAFAFGDRKWRIEFGAEPESLFIWNRLEAQGFLLASVLIAYLVAFATQGAAGRRAVIEDEVRSRTGELKQLAVDYRHACNEAAAANEAKSAFLATMSHEIRTPMNGVIGLVDVLRSSGLTAYQRDLVATMQRSGRMLLTLIDDILDFSKVEAGHMALDASPLHLAELLEGLCDSMLAPAREKGVMLQLYTSPELPECVLADEVRLRQIVYNLVGNGIKFSSGNPDRPGRVLVRAEPAHRPPYTLTLQVIDNGIGISEESQRRLFQPFTQGEADTTRRFGGTGLGLAVCRRLVELMGGEIDVDSRPGEGSCFTVRLPLKVREESPTAQLELSGLHCILVRGAVLEAEDLGSYLRHAAAAVDIVETLDAAAVRAQEIQAAVVIHDAAGPEPDAEGIHRDFGSLTRVRHLALTRGRRRRARRGRRGIVTLDAEALRRDSFIDAVAVAAGRAQPAKRAAEVDPAAAPESRPTPRRQAAASASAGDGLADMSSLHCILVDGDGPAMQPVVAALAGSHIRLVQAGSMSEAARQVRRLHEPAVVIHDTGGEPVSFDRLRAHFGQMAGVGHVALTRGRRHRPRYAVQELVSLDVDELQIEELWRAIAVAAGLAPVGSVATEGVGTEVMDKEAVDAARRQGRLILVAEDDPTNQRVIRAQLGALGLVAEVAADGREALQRWRNGRYGLLLVDLHMPQLDGYSLTRAIREEEAPGEHVPIIALTANALRGEPRRAREAGMDGYLVKPVASDLLRSTIEQWLPVATADQSGPLQVAAHEMEPAVAVDLAVLKALVGDDPALLRGLLGDYRDNAAARVAELRAAWTKGDLEALAGAAHKLKSSSRSVGAAALGELCATLEEAARSGQQLVVERQLATLAAVHQRADAAVEELLRTL